MVSTLEKKSLEECIEATTKIPQKRSPKQKSYPGREILVDLGLSICEIAEREGVSRQAVDSWFQSRTEQHALWKEKRKIMKEYSQKDVTLRAEIFSTLVGQVDTLVSSLAENSSWAEQKAVEYFQQHPGVRYPFEQLTSLFQNYQDALERGEKISLEQLGRKSGIANYAAFIGKILSNAGLEPMNGKIERHCTPKGKKEALQRAYEADLEISVNDVAHFLDLPESVCSQYFNIFFPEKLGERVRKKSHFVSSWFGRGHLTHRVASQIYEAEDARFTFEEICQRVNKPDFMVHYALEHRKEVEEKIMRDLQVLYPERKIETPYLT